MINYFNNSMNENRKKILKYFTLFTMLIALTGSFNTKTSKYYKRVLNYLEKRDQSIKSELIAKKNYNSLQLQTKVIEEIIKKEENIIIELPNKGIISALLSTTGQFQIISSYKLNENALIKEIYTDNNQNIVNLEEITEGDSYIKLINGKKVSDLPNQGTFIFNKYNNVLTQLTNYINNPKGELPEITTKDEALKKPYLIPQAGIINWEKIDNGYYFTLIDIMFSGKIVDRIAIAKLNPEFYNIETHNDYKNRKTIEEWTKTLNADVVINGSFYKTEPYGAPLAQMLENGKQKGDKLYPTGGTILFQPKDSDNPKIKVIDHKDFMQNLENYNYEFGMNSYPALYDLEGKTRCKSAYYKWRANRTILGVDNQKNVLFGNTQEGFFALWRLGRFFKSIEQNLNLVGGGYILNMDGGPPAQIMARNQNFSFKYIQYGYQEGNNDIKIHWNKSNKSKWQIPTVISATRKEATKK